MIRKATKQVDVRFLEILWNGACDTISGSGEFADRFVGPNKVLRKGIMDISANEKFEGIEYSAVITLGKLIPKKQKAVA